MTAYATRAEFEAYVPGWTTTDPAALDAVLAQASRDVDYLLGARAPIETGTYAGLKVDPTRLAAYERVALSRATCAQAHHVIEQTDAAEAGRVPKSVAGPDFTVDYGEATTPAPYAQRLAVELAPIRHLRPATARMR